MIIGIGADHKGFWLKEVIIQRMAESGTDVRNMGCFDVAPTDYPDIAQTIAHAVAVGQCAKGILICGTGIGMSIAANKIFGARAALCYDVQMANLSRQHNDANILCLSGGLLNADIAWEITQAFLNASFEGGRHKRRVQKIIRSEKMSEDRSKFHNK